MARPSNTAERRAQIVRGLMHVLSRTGWAGATVAAIAKEAGLATGLVHYHFASKREILLALMTELEQTVATRYLARREGLDARGQLLALVDAHLELGRDADPAAVGAWNALGAEALSDPQVRRIYRRTLVRSLGELRRLVRRTRGAAGHARVAASILCAIEGALRVGSLAPATIPRGSAAKMVRSIAEALLDDEGTR